MTVLNSIKDQIRQQTLITINNNFSHLAVSTNSSAITGSETTLDGEVFREQVLSDTSLTANTIRKSIHLNSAQANGNIIRKLADFSSETETQPNSISLINSDMIEKTNQNEFLLSIIYTVTVT